MSAHVEVDRDASRLLISLEGWDALRHSAGVTLERPPVQDGALAQLERAGLVGDAGLSAGLARVVGVTGTALADLRLARAQRETRAWIDAESVVALVPRGELFELAAVERRFAADLVARLVELGPRPEPPRSTLRLGTGELALAIANGAGPVGGGTGLGEVRDHWRLDITTRDRRRLDGRCLEVVDSAAGWWELVPERGVVVVRPTTEASLRGRIEDRLADAVAAAPP